MSGDILSDAVKALREETAESAGTSELTRARIMASVRERRRRRAGWVTVLVPVAAVLVVGSALATATGQLPEALQRLMSGTGGVEQPEPTPNIGLPSGSAPKQAASASEVAPEPEPAPVPEPEPEPEPEPALEATTNDVDKSSKHPRIDAPPAAKTDEQREPIVAPSDTEPQELYRAAHQAHFQQRDYAAAIRKYERYLAAAPGGRFALEASYNRALCLARVGRSSEAVSALRPFAQGRYGAYRQREAAALVEALTTGGGAGATSSPSPAPP
jgi:hypothetical protein